MIYYFESGSDVLVSVVKISYEFSISYATNIYKSDHLYVGIQICDQISYVFVIRNATYVWSNHLCIWKPINNDFGIKSVMRINPERTLIFVSETHFSWNLGALRNVWSGRSVARPYRFYFLSTPLRHLPLGRQRGRMRGWTGRGWV